MHRSIAYVLIPLLLLMAAIMACGPAGDGKPALSITAPPNGARVAVGQIVEVTFVATDERAVAWVKMTVDDAVVATQESPLEAGQTPLEGILRWTPQERGTFRLVLTAQNTAGRESDPAAVSIEVIEETAGVPTPTRVNTPRAQPPTPTATRRPGQPTATRQPASPSPTTKPDGPAGQRTATATPTKTPTQRPPAPTHTPTQRPTATETQVPGPEIVHFYADRYTLGPGQCTGIYWQTRDAHQVSLNGERVAANGDRTYCSADLGGGMNTFELRASNGSETAMQSLTVVKQEPQVLNAPFVPGFSGSASDHGAVGNTIYPGDDDGNNNYIGFITFDMTSLPGDATIQSATLDLGPCSTNGDPFTGLAGELYVTYLYYGDLEAGDYSAGGGEYLGSVYGCPGGEIDVTASVDGHKADAYYQLTLSWPVHSDFDGTTDDVTYTAPTLEIVYAP
jgi:hypothetical protein